MNTQDSEISKVYCYLNQEKRFLGFTLDESIPSAILGAGGIIIGQSLTGIFLAAVWFSLIKKAKQGQGLTRLLAVFYWYVGFMPGAFKKIPSAKFVHWIS